MQWKIPFKEYFENDRTRVNRIAQEFTVSDSPLPDGPKEQLSEPQLNVVKRFPSPLDTLDRNWSKMEQLVNAWKDNSYEIWPMAHNLKIIAGVNTLSAIFLTHRFRRAFNLADGRTGVLNSYVPAIALPMFFGAMIHYKVITVPIVSGYEQCSVCQCLKAGLIQAISSSLYPLIYSSVSSIYFADYFTTYPTPDSIKDQSSRKYLYDIWYKAVKRNKTAVISVAIINFIFAYYMTYRERECIEFMYFSLLQKEYKKLNKNV